MPKLARRAVGISGNMTRPSRTRVLVDAILAEIARRGWGETASYDLLDAGPGLGTATSREGAPEALDRVWREIETCDVLVVGSPNSSNSVRMVEVARLAGTPARLVPDVSHLDPDWLAGAGTVGLSAGASAPEVLVDEVLDRLAELGYPEVRLASVATEDVVFALPSSVGGGIA